MMRAAPSTPAQRTQATQHGTGKQEMKTESPTHRLKACVKSFSQQKGFGLLTNSPLGRVLGSDVFVFSRHLVGRQALAEGDVVEFELFFDPTTSRPQARKVRVIETAAKSMSDWTSKQPMELDGSIEYDPAEQLEVDEVRSIVEAARAKAERKRTANIRGEPGASPEPQTSSASQNMMSSPGFSARSPHQFVPNPSGSAFLPQNVSPIWFNPIPTDAHPGSIASTPHTKPKPDRDSEAGHELPNGTKVRIIDFPIREFIGEVAHVRMYEPSTQRYSIALEDETVGVQNFWISGERIEAIRPATGTQQCSADAAAERNSAKNNGVKLNTMVEPLKSTAPTAPVVSQSQQQPAQTQYYLPSVMPMARSLGFPMYVMVAFPDPVTRTVRIVPCLIGSTNLRPSSSGISYPPPPPVTRPGNKADNVKSSNGPAPPLSSNSSEENAQPDLQGSVDSIPPPPSDSFDSSEHDSANDVDNSIAPPPPPCDSPTGSISPCSLSGDHRKIPAIPDIPGGDGELDQVPGLDLAARIYPPDFLLRFKSIADNDPLPEDHPARGIKLARSAASTAKPKAAKSQTQAKKKRKPTAVKEPDVKVQQGVSRFETQTPAKKKKKKQKKATTANQCPAEGQQAKLHEAKPAADEVASEVRLMQTA